MDFATYLARGVGGVPLRTKSGPAAAAGTSELEEKVEDAVFVFGDAAKTSVLNSSWTKRVEKIAQGFVVGYENTSQKTYRLTLDFSESTNMEVKESYGADISALVATKIIEPGNTMIIKLGAADPTSPYGYKMSMEGESV